jgi:HEAT repeat protein
MRVTVDASTAVGFEAMAKNRLIEDLKSPDAETAMEAAKAIIASHLKVPIGKIEAIASEQNDSDWSRVAAIYLLGNLRNKKSAPKLAEILRREQEKPLLREYAAEALGNIGDSTFLPLVSKVAAETTQAEIRMSCEFAIAEMRAAQMRNRRSA